MMSNYSQKLAEHCESQIDTLVPINDGPELIMDPHQKEAMELAAMAVATNEKAFSIIHSCGSGKTILEGNLAVASQRAKEELGIQNTQDVILTTQRALLHSIYEKLDDLGLDVGMWGSGKVQLDRQLVLANIQAIQNSVTRGDLSKKIKIDETPLLIGDEADLFLTRSRKRAISQFPDAIKIGLTATDAWPDGRDVEDLWGKKIHEMRLKEGILTGVNVPPLYYLFEANMDDSQLEYAYGDYEQKSLRAALKEAEIQKAIPEIYEALIPKSRRKDFPTLVYVPSVNLVYATVQELKDKLTREGVKIGSWTGESTSTVQIKKDMEDFNDGKLDILVLCEMGSRGVDLPRARCLIDGYPTLSSNKLEQRAGRVLRRVREESQLHKEGFKKAFAMIAQIIPRSNKYRPILLPDILNCWEDFKQGRLLGIQNSNIGGNNGGETGSPIQAEVDEIRRHIIQKNPKVHVRKVEEIDVLSQLVLREDLQKADDKGFFYIDEERYGVATVWESELGISSSIIVNRIKKSETQVGISRQGRVSCFYSETLVRQRCADLLEELPQVGEDGFFEKDGVKYGTLTAWSREYGIANNTIKNRLEGIENIKGKLAGGAIYEFYAELDIRERCEDLINIDYQSDENGFFEIDDEIYGTITAWCEKLGLADTTIKKRVKEKGLAGKNRTGRVVNFYTEAFIRERCKDLIVLHQADKNGLLQIDGERYRTALAWAKEMNRPYPTIFKRLKKEKGIKGKDSGGRICIFYLEEIFNKRCGELLDEMPQAGEDGFFEKDGARYGTAGVWDKELGITHQVIKKRLKNKGIKGRAIRGRIYTFYSEIDVIQKCKNYVDEMPQAGEDGFFEKDGERYGNITAWGRKFNVSASTLKKYLKSEQGIEIRDAGGRLYMFYSQRAVQEGCSALLEDMPKAGRDGFFEKDGEQYGTVKAWSRFFNIGKSTVGKYLEDAEGILAKRYGRIWTFYSESTMREKCSELLADMPKAGRDGFFEKDGEQYGTIKVWSEKFNINSRQVNRYLKEEKGILGRGSGGQIYTFYPENIAREKCKYLFEETPQARTDGFVYIGEERYGLRVAWAKEFGITISKLTRKLQDVSGVTGRDSGKHVRENGFYPESIVREKLADLINRK